jgi:hypothetical protein
MMPFMQVTPQQQHYMMQQMLMTGGMPMPQQPMQQQQQQQHAPAHRFVVEAGSASAPQRDSKAQPQQRSPHSAPQSAPAEQL